MNQATLDIIIFAVIALFLFFKLRNVLGEVDDIDQEKTKTPIKNPADSITKRTTKNDRLAKLNPVNQPGEWPTTLPDFKLVANATAHNQLITIHNKVPDFDPYHFLQGAKRAFSMIIDAFSKGDKKTLKNLLSDPLYQTYEQVIDERDNNGETWHSDIVDLTKAVIANADLDGNTAIITVDFEAIEKITARDKEGNFIDDQKGDSEKTENSWTFTKDLKNKNNIWTLTKTDTNEE